MNIVHLIPGLGMGGAEKVVLTLCREMDRSRYSPFVVYWNDDEALLAPLKDSGAGVIKIKPGKVISIDTVLMISGVLRGVKADLVHTHFMDADLLGFLSSRFLKIPQVIDIHSYPFPLGWKHAFRYRVLSCFADRILCVSNAVKDHLVRKTGISSGKIAVVYNGIDPDGGYGVISEDGKTAVKNALGIDKNETVIGNVSRLIPDKGQKYLLLAAPEIIKKYPKVKFLIIGDGVLRNELESLARELGINSKVVFAGTRRDVPALLGIMDIFVFPTFNEALGISVLEAMAAGKPVIATDDAAIPEIIRHDREGILVHPGDAAAIAMAVERLLGDRDAADQMGRRAKERVKDFFDDAMVKNIENVYDGILK